MSARFARQTLRSAGLADPLLRMLPDAPTAFRGVLEAEPRCRAVSRYAFEQTKAQVTVLMGGRSVPQDHGRWLLGHGR